MTKDYYRTLGVLDDAEDIVIRAAYKALAQRYHPDKWAGDKGEATRRMADINEAFEILSDPVKRKTYDSTRVKNQFEEEDLENEEELLSSVERDWSKVCEYFPDLRDIGLGLARISKSLEYTYKITLLERKNFDERKKYAEALEKYYLEKYFGTNEEIIKFSKKLILGKHKDAAKELNEVVRLLGQGIEPKTVIEKIIQKFNLKNFMSAIVYAQYVLDGRNDLENVNFLEFLGCRVDVKFMSFQVCYGDINKSLSIGEFNKLSHAVAEDFLKTLSVGIIHNHLTKVK
ncbi:J domain-containing protein [Polynucleobacter nymphae]|uniref:J domain-containing protein n=1 Tax=Polynucleobacter nymphae TaxID=2081043 RepID=UPI001C0BB9C2|nr:J domain-containing protein [Polynucleobacter nymphae]MBU3608916.1 J domain-containing protein [Polynucleobacter nymphae]